MGTWIPGSIRERDLGGMGMRLIGCMRTCSGIYVKGEDIP